MRSSRSKDPHEPQQEPQQENEHFTGDVASSWPSALVVLAVLFVLLVGLGLMVKSCDGEEITNEYVFAVAARGPGLADTEWRAGICIYNPHYIVTVVHVFLVQDGEWVGMPVVIDPGATACSDDFILEWFGYSEYSGGLVIEVDPLENPQHTTVSVVPSVWEYNDTGGGTVGTEVLPFPIFDEQEAFGWVYPYGAATGLNNYGTPGEHGFRASVGVFNPYLEDQLVHFRALASGGSVIWERRVPVGPYSQVQIPVPRWARIRGGTVEAFNELWEGPGDEGIYGYLTVTDNRTGDGVFKPMFIPYSLVIETADDP